MKLIYPTYIFPSGNETYFLRFGRAPNIKANDSGPTLPIYIKNIKIHLEIYDKLPTSIVDVPTVPNAVIIVKNRSINEMLGFDK